MRIPRLVEDCGSDWITTWSEMTNVQAAWANQEDTPSVRGVMMEVLQTMREKEWNSNRIFSNVDGVYAEISRMVR